MVKDNIQVDKVLQPRPESKDLDYPTEPHYEPVLSYVTTAKKMQREQRNLKRRIDWQNTFITAQLPILIEPNEEAQLVFAGPIPDKNLKDSYILASVDRNSSYPHAKVYHNWDADTATGYLEKYIKFHGIPGKLRCDQAQAFKSREFKIL